MKSRFIDRMLAAQVQTGSRAQLEKVWAGCPGSITPSVANNESIADVATLIMGMPGSKTATKTGSS